MWTYNIKQMKEDKKVKAIKVMYRETDRRTKVTELVKYCKNKLEKVYPPTIVKEYLSVLFRQKGILSLNIYTRITVNVFRAEHPLDLVDALVVVHLLSKMDKKVGCTKHVRWTQPRAYT